MNVMNIKMKYIIFGLVLFGLLLMIFNNSRNSNEIDSFEIIKPGKGKNAELINLNELFFMGECLLKQASKQIVKVREESNDKELSDKKKEDGYSIVTTADLQSHNIIVHTLKDKYENLVVKSEENTNDDDFDTQSYLETCDSYVRQPEDKYAPINDLIIYVDPLDATQEYSENLIDYVTVMFCIVDKGVPRAGIIHKVFSNQTTSSFYQSLSLKRFKKDGNQNRVIVSRSHAGTVKSIIDEKLDNAKIITAAGSGFKTVELVKNGADVYLHSTLIKRWDICAPDAILRNLGGKLTRLDGEKVDYTDMNTKANVVDGILASLYDYDYFFKIFKKV